MTGESDPDDMLTYLEKRHPLYFLQRKLSKPQIKNLIKKLIYKVGQMKPSKPASAAPQPSAETKDTSTTKEKVSSIFTQNKRNQLRELENKALEKENVESRPTFKSGGQLPTLSDDLPPVGGAKKASAVKFRDDFDDDFSEGDDVDSPNEANNNDEDEEEDDQDGDFDANALLNLGDYQKKRQGLGMGAGLGRDKENPLPSLAPISAAKKAQPVAQRSVLGVSTTQAGADEAFEFSDEEDDIESSVEEKKRAVANIDFDKFDYSKADLNKLSDEELKAHKAAMEVKFKQNAVKKGDPGFQYDKRVDF